MARISIWYVGDLQASSESILLVDSDVSYIAACQAIAEHSRTVGETQIWVRNKGHFAWLRSFIGQLSIEAEFSEKTPRTILALKWDTVIPTWVSDDMIQSSKLLELEPDGEQGKSFEDVLLSQLLDRTFAVDSLNADNAAFIVTTLTGDRYRDVAATYPLVPQCVKNKAAQWRQNSAEKWIIAVCELLPEKALAALRWFGAWSLLKQYPDELLARVIPPGQVATVRSIPAKAVATVTLEPAIREEALTQIELYLAEATPLIKANADYQKIVSCMSGRLTEEFKFALSLLETGHIDPRSEDIELVQRTFDACPGLTRSRLHALTHRVRPAYPTLLGDSEEWSADRWASWTMAEYAPYREWQIRNGKYDAALETVAGRFSDWYINNYLAVHADVNLGLTYGLNSLNASLNRNGLTVVMIVDCLPFAYAPLMDHALRSAGFNFQSQHYRYASLPTVTEYNKAALIAGVSDIVANNYSGLLSERSARDWGGVPTYYAGTLKALSDLQIDADSAIVLVNYIEGDEILHSDVESKNRTYDDELARVYSQLAEALMGLCERWSGPKDEVRVLLVTDHGACRILQEEARTFSSNIVDKLFDDEKHRMATMTSDQAAKIASNLWDLGYRFSTPFSGNDLVHFLPRGHNTVRNTGAGRGYLHGGITPEEVIVPAAVYGLIAIEWKRPFARFINVEVAGAKELARFFIQRIVHIQIEVQNPNPVPLYITAIEALAPEAAVKDVGLATISPASIANIHIDLYFQKSAMGADALELALRYRIGGAEHELALNLPAEFKSATAPGLNLRNL